MTIYVLYYYFNQERVISNAIDDLFYKFIFIASKKLILFIKLTITSWENCSDPPICFRWVDMLSFCFLPLQCTSGFDQIYLGIHQTICFIKTSSMKVFLLAHLFIDILITDIFVILLISGSKSTYILIVLKMLLLKYCFKKWHCWKTKIVSKNVIVDKPKLFLKMLLLTNWPILKVFTVLYICHFFSDHK